MNVSLDKCIPFRIWSLFYPTIFELYSYFWFTVKYCARRSSFEVIARLSCNDLSHEYFPVGIFCDHLTPSCNMQKLWILQQWSIDQLFNLPLSIIIEKLKLPRAEHHAFRPDCQAGRSAIWFYVNINLSQQNGALRDKKFSEIFSTSSAKTLGTNRQSWQLCDMINVHQLVG